MAEEAPSFASEAARYRRLFERWEGWDSDCLFLHRQHLDVNEYLIDMLGYSHEEFLLMSVGRSAHSKIPL